MPTERTAESAREAAQREISFFALDFIKLHPPIIHFRNHIVPFFTPQPPVHTFTTVPKVYIHVRTYFHDVTELPTYVKL